MIQKDRRRFPRYKVSIDATVFPCKKEVKDKIRTKTLDLSYKGCRLEMNQELEKLSIGDSVMVELILPNIGPIILKGIVKHKDEGVGIDISCLPASIEQVWILFLKKIACEMEILKGLCETAWKKEREKRTCPGIEEMLGYK